MKLNILLVLFCVLASSETLFAQIQKPIDTINYLVDLDRVPIKDRILTSDTDATHRFYEIKCRCLIEGKDPVFVYSNRRGYTMVSKDDLKSVKFISLASLIELLTKAPPFTVYKNHVFFFYEPDGKMYRRKKVFYDEPRGTVY